MSSSAGMVLYVRVHYCLGRGDGSMHSEECWTGCERDLHKEEEEESSLVDKRQRVGIEEVIVVPSGEE